MGWSDFDPFSVAKDAVDTVTGWNSGDWARSVYDPGGALTKVTVDKAHDLGLVSDGAYELREDLYNPIKGITRLMMRNMPDMRRDREVMTQAPDAARRIIYGRCKVAGAICYAQSSGGQNETINLIVVFAGHEVDAIETIYLDDVPLTDARFDGLRSHAVYLGDQTVADSAMVALGGNWTADHILKGCAYIRLSLTWADGVFNSGLPTISATIKGKKLLDPRTGLTVWSDNTALCCYDYLRTSKQLGGLGCTVAEIDTAEIIAAANTCDQLVVADPAGSTTEKRYTCNGPVDTKMPPLDNLTSLLTSMVGSRTYVGGKWIIRAGAPATNTPIKIDETWLRGGMSFPVGGNAAERVNTVKANYFDAAENWGQKTTPIEVNATYLAADGGEELAATLNLPFTTSAATAQRLAHLEMALSRLGRTVTVPCNLRAFQLVVGDAVELSRDELGWVDHRFIVLDWKYAIGGGIDLVLGEDDTALYDWAAGDIQPVSTPPAITLADPYTVADPTALVLASGPTHLLRLADGTVVPRIYASWVASASAFVTRYEVEYRLDTEPDWTQLQPVTDTRAYVGPVVGAGDYLVRIRAVNDIGAKSAWVSTGHTAVADTVAPPDPTSFSATGELLAIRLAWTFPATAITLHHVEIWTGTTTPTTQLAAASGADWLHSNLSAGQTVKYWLRPVSNSGIAGSYYPSGGLSGFVDNDPTLLTDALNSALTESQLGMTLSSRMEAADKLPAAVLESALVQEVEYLRGWETKGRVAIAEQTLTTHETDIAAEATARLLLAARVTTTEGDIVTNAASITAEATARANADTAIASDVTTLTTTVGGHTTTIGTHTTSINGLSAQYTLKLDNNGFPAGWGLASDTIDGTPYSKIISVADQHAWVNPNVAPITVSSITRSASTATATTAAAHGLTVGKTAVLVGAAQPEYTGAVTVVSVPTSTTFTFTVTGTPATPATLAPGFSAFKVGQGVVPMVIEGGEVMINTAVIGTARITAAMIGSIDADTITAGTLTGRTIQTASSGKRAVLSSSSNEVEFYGDRGDSTVEKLAAIGLNSTTGYTAIAKFGVGGSTRVAIHAESSGALTAGFYGTGDATVVKAQLDFPEINGIAGEFIVNGSGGVAVKAATSATDRPDFWSAGSGLIRFNLFSSTRKLPAPVSVLSGMIAMLDRDTTTEDALVYYDTYTSTWKYVADHSAVHATYVST